jgi:hypothetical protein
MMSSRKARVIWRRLHCLNPNLQWCNRTLIVTTPQDDAIEIGLIAFLNPQPLLGGRWGTTPLKGMSRTPKSHSIRSTLTEHEIA